MYNKTSYSMMGAIVVLVMAVLAPTVTQGQPESNRDRRISHNLERYTLSGNTSRWSDASPSWGVTAGYEKNLWSSNFMLGVQISGNKIITPDTLNTQGENRSLVGMDLTVGFHWKPVSWIYIQPTILAGVGAVNKNTVLWGDIDPLTLKRLAVRRDQSFLTWEAGARVEVGAQLGWLGIGVYAQYMLQDSRFQPTSATNMEVAGEWATSQPFTAGIAASIVLDHGVQHQGGDNIPMVEAFGGMGSKGPSMGFKILWNRQTGFWHLLGKPEGLRKEFVFATEYGLQIYRTFSEVNTLTAQFGLGGMYFPKGPKSPLLFGAHLFSGISEMPVWMSTAVGEIYDGYTWTVEPTVKTSIDAQLVWRPVKWRQFNAFIAPRVSYDIPSGNKVAGEVEIMAQGEDMKRLSWDITLGVRIGL